MKAERSSDELKILELFKSDNIELGIQLCKAVGLDVTDLLASWFDDFDYNTGVIKIGEIRVMAGSWEGGSLTGVTSLFWGASGVTPDNQRKNEIYSTMYDDFTDYKKLAVVVYNVYCELKLK